MKNLKHSLKYGTIAGLVMCTSWVVMNIFFTTDGKLDFEKSEFSGYTFMILALTAVFMGVKAYRDQELNGLISFWKAFRVGLNIVLVASVIYVVAWCIYYPNFMPDFREQYMESQILKFEAEGLPAAEVKAKTDELAGFMKMYENPWVMVAMTFMEVFPIGLVVALISALILKRKAVKTSG